MGKTKNKPLSIALSSDDAALLADRAGGGPRRPLTLTQFRERIERKQTDQLDLFDYGGCGCAID